jgi:hypothetical protein
VDRPVPLSRLTAASRTRRLPDDVSGEGAGPPRTHERRFETGGDPAGQRQAAREVTIDTVAALVKQYKANRNVKRWREGAVRWVAAGVLEATRDSAA